MSNELAECSVSSMTADDIIIIIIMTDRRRHRIVQSAFCAHLVVFIVIRGCCTIEIADMKTIYKKKRKKILLRAYLLPT